MNDNFNDNNSDNDNLQNNKDETFSKCIKNIENLFSKYNSDPYMYQRLQYHLLTILPSTLENESKNHKQRVIRTHYLMNEQQIFIQVFLSKKQYFYLPTNSCFYYYDGKNYITITEDEIQHELLTTISKDKTLMHWKHKTKINIIRQIKERNLFSSTPESETFQAVLNILCPTFFSNRQEAKYFLTVLGDNILKKNNDLIFLLKPKTKKFMIELDAVAYYNIGITNITHTMITKFHEVYAYEKCRLIKMNDTVSLDIWMDTLKKMGLNLLCVAAHYSNRYGNSDTYLLNHMNEDSRNYTCYLKNTNQQEIIKHFCDYALEPSNPNSANSTNLSIQWKNMHYLWKLFISNHGFPNMIYANTLKNLLKEKFENIYNEEQDTFLNITSKYLPITSDFIVFWEKTIQVVDNGDSSNDEEFEIDEICSLFKSWVQENADVTLTNGNINDHAAVKLITHFFPSVEIVENKFLLNVRCKLWNKLADIQHSLHLFKHRKQMLLQASSANGTTISLISIDELYQFYCSECKTRVASKRYFEKYVSTILATHILFDKFISVDWVQH